MLKRPIFYLTFNESPVAGIYRSQVVDVVSFLNNHFEVDIRLLAFLPLRNYRAYVKQMKEMMPNAICFPQIPLPRFILWRLNVLSLIIICLIYRPKGIIARNPFANYLSLIVKKLGLLPKLIFDSRGLIKAESEEYDVYPSHVKRQIPAIESVCTLESDLLMVITEGMTSFFRKVYGYAKDEYVVIPCTLGLSFNFGDIDPNSIRTQREKLGFGNDEIVLVYAGSSAGWQSFGWMLSFLNHHLENDKRVKVLLLTKTNNEIQQMIQKFPGRVQCKWVSHDEVGSHLLACDYGLLIRESSITNSVSSPTKFAEYLGSGLPVIASDTMAITDFIKENQAGHVLFENQVELALSRPSLENKKQVIELAKTYFKKDAAINIVKYQFVLDAVEVN